MDVYKEAEDKRNISIKKTKKRRRKKGRHETLTIYIIPTPISKQDSFQPLQLRLVAESLNRLRELSSNYSRRTHLIQAQAINQPESKQPLPTTVKYPALKVAEHTSLALKESTGKS